MKSRISLKIISVVLAVALVIASIPMIVSADSSSIRFGVISDIHYYPQVLKGEKGEGWQEFLANKHKEYDDLDSLIENALDGVLRNAAEDGATYVLIPGDLTKDGEYEGHVALAEKFAAFEEETGIPVFVIPGNHDINNSNASSFKNDVEEPARITTPEEFREIYADFGYNEADSVFVPAEGKKGGMLSYAKVLGDYKLIAIDSCMYSEDNGAEDNEHMTDGRIADGLLDWIIAECESAEEEGLTVVAMQHHNLIPHTEIEEATFWPFVVQEWLKIADAYADAGMHYVFTGHLHSNDVASYVNDNGEEIHDILTPTLSGYPNYYKIVDFVSDGTNIRMSEQTLDVDKYQPVKNDDGTVYEAPFKYTYSYERTFGEGSVKELLDGIIHPFIGGLFADIQAAGGLIDYLATKNLDLEKIIIDALGTNGLAIGNMDILTVSGNVMGFINDLGSQIDNVYINDIDGTLAKIDTILNKLLSYEVSEKPCTILNEKLGYPLTGKGCTIGELASSVMLMHYAGDENIENYPYITDILDSFESGELAEEFFNLLREVVVTDLVQNEILANLDFNPGELFPAGTLFRILGLVLQGATEVLLGGDNSFINLIESVLSIPLIPEEYSSIDAIIDHLAGEYITFSQFEAWGYTISWMLGSFFLDDSADNNVTLTYNGPVEVEATQENYRLPAQQVVNLGEDSSTEITVTWLTKYSITASDIELLPYSENPEFTGKPTVDSRIAASSETVQRSYPGADLGIFSLLPYTIDYTQHTVKLSGLEAGTKYCYRVGDAEKGWWSEAGVLETAGGNSDDAFTFFYVTDPQAQRKDQFERFAEVIETARETHPEGKFIVSAGDQVDAGEHVKHWSYLLNSTTALLDLPLMPTSGNHEDAQAAISSVFTLPNVPEQDEESGVYYSYDYNGVHFTVLNTNDIEDDKLGKEQLEWLKNDIKNSDAQWKMVVLHKALYSNGSHYDDGDVEGMRKQLGALLPYLGVDLVLQGHDHVYLRTDALNANAVVPSKTENVTYNGLDYEMKINPRGTIYSICGTSGVKIYKTKDVEATDKSFPRAEAIVDSEYSMFSAITVEGNELYYNAYQVVDGEAKRVDSFALSKTKEAPADKIKNENLSDLIADFLSDFNVSALWKIVNFALDVFGKVFSLISKAF